MGEAGSLGSHLGESSKNFWNSLISFCHPKHRSSSNSVNQRTHAENPGGHLGAACSSRGCAGDTEPQQGPPPGSAQSGSAEASLRDAGKGQQSLETRGPLQPVWGLMECWEEVTRGPRAGTAPPGPVTLGGPVQDPLTGTPARQQREPRAAQPLTHCPPPTALPSPGLRRAAAGPAAGTRGCGRARPWHRGGRGDPRGPCGFPGRAGRPASCEPT